MFQSVEPGRTVFIDYNERYSAKIVFIRREDMDESMQMLKD